MEIIPTSTSLPSFKKLEQAAQIGDVHMGHPNTPTEHIVSSLRSIFPDNSITGALNVIWITGDLFDRQLSMKDPEGLIITQWMVSFLRMCKKWDISLRILEGTPSHDWKQSRWFVHQNEINDIGCDVKYFSDLSIEYMEKYGIHVLYVPDEWRVSCDDTWLEVVALLKQHNLEKVDFAIMHGAFPHQLPKNIHHQTEMHDPERYLSIVKKFIMVGHVHFYSQYERIIAAGSTERLSHGEEGPKGHVRYEFHDDGNDRITFIENKKAQRYDTINCTGLDADALHAAVATKIESLPPGSFIRFKAAKGDVAVSSIDYFKETFPQFTWSVAVVGDGKTEEKPTLIDTRNRFKSISITKDNIVTLLMDRVTAKAPHLFDRAKARLEETING